MRKSIKQSICLIALSLFITVLTSGCRDVPERTETVTKKESQAFQGKIKKSIRDSDPKYLAEKKAKKGSPNVVIVLADDLGYADLGCYGSEIHTPNIDRLAENGIRYRHFTVTAICSPTRAALLTGLNHHSAGTGWLAEWDFGYPSYRGEILENVVMLPEVLKENGYQTLMVGKWHLTNHDHRSLIGPFESWPTQRGFDRYWGFLDGEASQWLPHALVSGNEIIQPPQDGSFYFPDAMSDNAIEMIRDLRAHDAEQPFFMYYATGATHAPHHTKAVDREKYKGAYEKGWDKVREQRLAKQKDMGLVPASTRLSGYNPGVKPWVELSPDQQRMYARFQENYAAFVDNLDQNVGRLIDYLDEIDELDNTLFIFMSDNGASREVGVEGSSNVLKFYHRRPATNAENLKDYDQIGEPGTHPHYPHGWMQASNTPFIHAKRTTYGGGVRVPLIVSWPEGIKAKNEIRTQFHHVNDIMPTILEAIGVEPPTQYKGRPIKPIEGISMQYSFKDGDAEAKKKEQYYEMEGHRAYYSEDWKLVSHREGNQPFDEAPWRLFNLEEDFSETRDLAGSHPDKVKALETKWWEAADRYGVLPIIDVALLDRPRFSRRWEEPGRSHFVYRPGARTILRFRGPVLPNRSYTISADLVRRSKADEGVIVALGDLYSGYTLFIKDNLLHYELNVGHTVTRLTSTEEVPTGPVNIQYRFKKVSLALSVAKGFLSEGADFDRLAVLKGTGSLYINGEKAGETQIDQPLFAVWEGLDIGMDRLSPVSPAYQTPFAFTGTLEKVVYDLR
ncbi:MAG: arylsulfatase [Deltaproteobacteria bacterium]|nr:arylsulfatase [Deltaproteobacteria bacterium]